MTAPFMNIEIRNNSLTEKAMLVTLSISQWTARKLDKEVTETAAEQYHADTRAGRYNKLLVPKKALAMITTCANAARKFHYEQTLPWHDNGARILPAENYLHYSQNMQDLKLKFEKAVAEFLQRYDEYREEAKLLLGNMFRYADYPTWEKLEEKFKFSVSVSPLPSGQDFRVGIADEEIRRIQQDLEARLVDAQVEAMKDLWQRLYKAVSHMADKLTDLDGRFKNSLVGNLCDLVDLLPRLNLTNDPVLEQMRRDVEESLCIYEPEELRKNPVARKEAAEAAIFITAAMEGYMGGFVNGSKN
ncbi:hypothetical protein GF1_16770 [Desulfolithobacter dissulfuricans]|uniref:DUF3150 domain-containing protein n=2 Tax=Desulfolithobacter dissulfuricans TaxID=2795293 RepID=A0A915U0N2_9BACT|nr:hypothetical protein GF1_16770 [Desulfolithobacter dissulfuricans]